MGFDTENQTLHQDPEWECVIGGYTGGLYTASPAIGLDGAIYFGDQKNIYALEANGAFKWKTDILTDRVNTPSVGTDGIIYVFAGRVSAINPDNGQIIWQTIQINVGPPSMHENGTLYVTGHSGGEPRFYSVRSADGVVLHTFSPTQSGQSWESVSLPVLAENGVYIMQHDTLMGFDYQDNLIGEWVIDSGISFNELIFSENGDIFLIGSKFYAISE